MSYRAESGSYWERRNPEPHLERYGPRKTTAGRCHKDGDRACSSCNLGSVLDSESHPSRLPREILTRPASERDSKGSSCKCPTGRPQNGCRDCRQRKAGPTAAIMRMLKKGGHEYRTKSRAAEEQDQPETRTKNPEGHVRLV